MYVIIIVDEVKTLIPPKDISAKNVLEAGRFLCAKGGEPDG